MPASPLRRVGRLLAAVTLRTLAATTLIVVAAAALALPTLPVLVASGDALDRVSDELLDAPPLPDELPVAAQLSTVHDGDGTRIAELAGEVRREPVALDDIPDVVIDAVLATEDQHFFDHQGVEHEAMARAAVRNVAAGGIAEGASTITQQYVKMTLLSPEQTVQRKLEEIQLAVALERRDSKERILEGYLNAIYLGEGTYGIRTAADHYFSAALDDLTVAQAATLAGAIQAPSVTNPVADPDAALVRRDVVLRQMRAQDRIDEDTAQAALDEELELDVRDRGDQEPFWVDTVKRLLYDPDAALQPGLQEALGDDVSARIDAIFTGGLRIETTLDRRLMAAAEDAIAAQVDDPEVDPMGALISVEHATGALRTFALGPHEFGTCGEDDDPCVSTTTNPTVPWGGGSGRQSGSAFKPFVAAAALVDGLDEGRPDDAPDVEDDVREEVLDDLDDGPDPTDPLVYDAPSGEDIEGCGTEDEPYAPRNFADTDAGVVDAEEAMRRSVNSYFAKLTRDVGVERVVEVAGEHGLRGGNLDTFGPVSCSLGLGSAEVFPLGMTVGYGTWANDGVRCEPYVIERVLDRDGEVLYEHEPRCERVVDEDTAAEVRELLRGPVASDGTAGVVSQRLGGEVFGKTGTTNDFRDAWFVGADGALTTSSWLGFEQPRAMRDLTLGGTTYETVTGGGAPASMWTDHAQAIRDLDAD